MHGRGNLDKDPFNDEVRNLICQLDAVTAALPGTVLVQRADDRSILYLDPQGLQRTGLSLEAVRELGPLFDLQYFRPGPGGESVARILATMKRQPGPGPVSFFQQVRWQKDQAWTWHCTALQVLQTDAGGHPLYLLALLLPFDAANHLAPKITRLLDETSFGQRQQHRYETLSRREKEILRLMALGKSSVQIAAALHIAPSTVVTHRRNIRRKLGVVSSYELTQYAHAFDLL
jgi:DNA-binding CsgD family transcriptional regulator